MGANSVSLATISQSFPQRTDDIFSLFSMIANIMRQSSMFSLFRRSGSASPNNVPGSLASNGVGQGDPFAQLAQLLAQQGRSQVLNGNAQSSRQPNAAPASGQPNATPASGQPNAAPQGAAGRNPGGSSGIMDLSGFKLMLPTGREGSPDMVQGQNLASYQSPHFRQENGALTFYAPVNGATSANSDTTRSELGEAQGWKIGSGPRSLSATLSVDETPASGNVSVGQLHQRGGSGRPPIMLKWNNGTVEASVLESNSPSARRQRYVLAENVPKGQKFNYNIDVAPDGTAGLSVNGKTTRVKLDPSFNDSDMYFKAGVYNQGGSSGGSKATFNALSISKP